MSYFALLFCTLASVTISTTMDIAMPCQLREGAASSGNPSTSTVSCNAGETMVSCGIAGLDNIGGTTISGSVCTAYDYSSGYEVKAMAECCTISPEVIASTSQVKSVAGTSVSATCPAGTVLTGCVALYVSGIADDIQGAFYGSSQPPTGNTEWASTTNTCNARSNAGTTVQAVATCLSIGAASYSMSCETQALYTNVQAGLGGCQAGYDMMSCSGFATNAALDSYYVTASDECFVGRDNNAVQFASAICCKLEAIQSECASKGDEERIENGCRCLDNCGGKLCKANVGGGNLCPDTTVCCCGGGCKAGEVYPAHQMAPMYLEEPDHLEPYFESNPSSMWQLVLTAAVTSICVLGCVFCFWFIINQQRKRVKYAGILDDTDV